MRWSDTFADLSGQFDGLRRLERDADLVEATRAVQAGIALSARLRGSIGHDLQVKTRVGMLEGMLDDVGVDWLSVISASSSDGSSAIIRLAAVEWIEGVDGRVDDRAAPTRTFPCVLGEVAARRCNVVLLADGGSLTGAIVAVCADHCLVRRASGGADTRDGNARSESDTGARREGSVLVPYAGLIAAIG